MVDTTVTNEKGKLYQFDLIQFQTDPNPPLKHLEPQASEKFAIFIAQHIVLEPILFRVGIGGGIVSSDPFFIVAGERRVETVKQGSQNRRWAKAEQSPDDVIKRVSRVVGNLNGIDTSTWTENEKFDLMLREGS